MAKEKARGHIRFEQASNKRKADETECLAPDLDEASSSNSESDSSGPSEAASATLLDKPVGINTDYASARASRKEWAEPLGRGNSRSAYAPSPAVEKNGGGEEVATLQQRKRKRKQRKQ